jgi:hypothetical protein
MKNDGIQNEMYITNLLSESEEKELWHMKGMNF